LTVAETFLALLLSWNNSSVNLQHVEVWRSATDNLSTAIFIGTTASAQFVDYVGASASYYYWVRSIGTDGTPSAFNDTAGTLGTTGLDPSDFEININVSAANLDAALAARIDLIDVGPSSLLSRMSDAEGDIVALDARTDTLEVDVSGVQATVSGHTTSINANASSISTNQVNISQLLVDLGIAQGDISDNAASISANASSILNLEANIGALDAEDGQTWEFTSTLEGFTGTNATVTGPTDGAMIFTPQSSNPYFTSETISITGGIYTQVVVRLRMTIGGGTWEGNCYYQTAGHGMSASYIKGIPDPNLSLGEWVTLTWDMTDLDAGGTDWVDSTIEAIRIDLVTNGLGKFEIDWILIAKFSSTAFSAALDAIDVRVTINENDISSHATRLTTLESTVDDATTGVVATSNALIALTTDVISNTSGVTANAAAITALQTTVNDGAAGVAANASAISVLQTEVSANDSGIEANASAITQLTASVDGGFASVVNPLQVLNEGFGSSFDDTDVQTFSIGGRSGIGAKQDATANDTQTVFRADGARIKIEPRGIYEVRFSAYHARTSDNGSFFYGFESYAALTGGSVENVTTINNGVLGAVTSAPEWLSGQFAIGRDEWTDVVCYIIGPEASAANCPDLSVNDSVTNDPPYDVFNDGFQVTEPYVELKIKNFNASPTYGDDALTTLWTTDLQVRRIDTAGSLFAAIQTEATVRASDIGDLNALYSVKVELSTGGDPYITGFGLSADVIDGVATSAFGIRADQFFITSPTYGTAPGDPVNSAFPFIIDLVGGVAQVAIDGALIVDGTIRADSIVAGSIGADRLNVTELSAITANTGTLYVGRLSTSSDAEPQTAFRVELEDNVATAYPLWYGDGAKSAGTGRFYVDKFGNVVINGVLRAGIIEQTYFAPADANDSFRIACDYPANYSGGVYTGKAAHILPIRTVNFTDTTVNGLFFSPSGTYSDFLSDMVTFLSPTEGSGGQYGRLGTNSEVLMINMAFSTQMGTGLALARMTLEYQYDSEGWKAAFHSEHRANPTAASSHFQEFVTRETAYSTLQFRLRVAPAPGNTTFTMQLRSATLAIWGPNFGYADETPVAVSTNPAVSSLPTMPRFG
jgi:hypothetical protein